MAIVLPETKCRICGVAATAQPPYVMFPPFVANELDPLFPFSDAVVHEACLRTHPWGPAARAVRALIHEQNANSVRRCVVCQEAITDPDDYLTTWYLTSDTRSPLFRFNWVQLHRRHLDQWEDWPEVQRILGEMRVAGSWIGPGIDYVAKQNLGRVRT
jgi:hypothetical protein